MAEYFANGHLRFQDGEWRDDNGDSVEIAQVKSGKWETVHGVLTPGGDPLKRCPFCKSRESEHLDGIEHPSRWVYCPICGAQLDDAAVLDDVEVNKSRCHKCVNEMHCPKDKDREGKCLDYKRDAPDGGYYR